MFAGGDDVFYGYPGQDIVMNITATVLLAFGMSMDAFAASIGKGATLHKPIQPRISKDEIISPVVQFCWWIEHVSDAARVSIDPGLAVGRYSPLRCEHRPDMAHPRVFSVVG